MSSFLSSSCSLLLQQVGVEERSGKGFSLILALWQHMVGQVSKCWAACTIVMEGPQGTSYCTVHCLWKLFVFRLLHPPCCPSPIIVLTVQLTHRTLLCSCLTNVSTAVCSVDTSLTNYFSPSLFSLCSDKHRKQSTIYYIKRCPAMK